MKRPRRLRVHALVASAAHMLSCSSDHLARNAGSSDAGIDGAASSCAGTLCRGTCIDGRCLASLARISSPVGLVLDGKSVYFTSCSGSGGSGEVISVPLGGGSPTTLASTRACSVGLAVTDTSLYLASTGGDSILTVPLGGGTVTTLASSADAPIGVASTELASTGPPLGAS